MLSDMGMMINRRRVCGGGEKLPYFVDMGLPSGTLWATRNIDVTQPDGFAASPYQYGCSYFSWANVDGHNPISTSAFDYNWGSQNSQEPWYEGQPYGETQGSTILGTTIPINDTYDAARANLGAPWCMPDKTQCDELLSNIRFINLDGTEIDTTQVDKRIVINGVRGVLLESTINGARLFFPATGNGEKTKLSGVGTSAGYWMRNPLGTRFARSFVFNFNYTPTVGFDMPHVGKPIRPVMSVV